MGHVATEYDAPTTDRLEPLLTISQAAEVLAVNRRTVYRLVERGALTATRAGSRLRFEPAELRRYVASGRGVP
jgi:excisionase family DNA binding protein